MTRRIAAVVIAMLSAGAPVSGQTIKAEAEVSAGRSTEQVNAGGFHARLFGPIAKSGWSLYLEAAWDDVWKNETTDAFAAAYPYDGQLRPMEAYVERTFRPAGRLVGVRAGRYRLPFGISGRSDHAYNGFVRAPLIRYGSYWGLSNTFMEAGVDVMAGTPSLYVETSVSRPSDGGRDYRRASGLDTVVRAQGYTHGVIIGVSHLRTQPNMVGDFVFGRMKFTGVDGRWTLGGIQLRGEWIDGQPFNDVATRGGYLDVIVHAIGMGPFTAVARTERLDYDAGPYSAYYRRLTVGGRLRVTQSLGVQANVLRQPRGPFGSKPTALDVGLTYSIRF